MIKKSDLQKNTSGTPRKPQESYPGIRDTKQAPSFVNEWEHEPPKSTDETDSNLGHNPNDSIYFQVEQIIKEIGFIVEDLQIVIQAEQIHLSGKVRQESIKSSITIELNKQIEGYEVFNQISIVD